MNPTREPVIVTAIVQVLATAGLVFGFELPAETVAMVVSVLVGAGAVLVRAGVMPVGKFGQFRDLTVELFTAAREYASLNPAGTSHVTMQEGRDRLQVAIQNLRTFVRMEMPGMRDRMDITELPTQRK